MKLRHLLMLTGLLGSAWLSIFGNTASDVEVALPIAASTRGAGAQASVSRGSPTAEAAQAVAGSPVTKEQAQPGEQRILALRPRAELIVERDIGGAERRLFSATNWAPPVVKAKPVDPPLPVAPPLPFAYLGKQLVGGQLEVYVTRGDRVLALRNQTVIEGTYRVESIAPPTMSLTYLPLNQIQKLPIGVTD